MLDSIALRIINTGCFIMKTCLLLLALLTSAAQAADSYNVVWDSPSTDAHGSMPLGNGDIGLNAWAQADGTIHLLISKTDAWDDNSRLVKVGEVVVHFDPNPFAGKFQAGASISRPARSSFRTISGSGWTPIIPSSI